LGGNALQSPGGEDSVEADFARTSETMRHLASLLTAGEWRLVVTHGNGPQVGNHLLRSELAHVHGDLPDLPLEVCVADTQGGMGYMIQQCLTNALHDADLPGVVVSVVTQVVVDPADPAFGEPTKPVGDVIAPERVDQLRRQGWVLVEDRARSGYRRVVPSPDPKEIVEAEAIRAVVDEGVIAIAVGGGGIPVSQDDGGDLHGAHAVIDKDLASSLLASDLAADGLLILTDVERVATGFGTPEEEPLAELTVSRARELSDAGEFPAGSMGPKIEALCRFVEGGGGFAAVGAIDKSREVLAGASGTRVVAG
jgi:carbamate kinase